MHEPAARGSVRIGSVATVDEGTNRPDAPILLVTKLHPPTVPSQIVAREPLFARLRSGRDQRLSLVACPAGFGKSSLLAAWRESELATRPVAWVTLHEGDDDARAGRTSSRRCPAPADRPGRAIPPARATASAGATGSVKLAGPAIARTTARSTPSCSRPSTTRTTSTPPGRRCSRARARS